MSATTTCDKCGNTAPNDSPDALIDWLKVGFSQTTAYDACSFHCAHGILKAMAKREAGVAA